MNYRPTLSHQIKHIPTMFLGTHRHSRHTHTHTDYLLQFTLASIGTVIWILHNWGSSLALSGKAPISNAACLKHSQRTLRDWVVLACLYTFSAPIQQKLLGAAGPNPTKNSSQGIKVVMASRHVIAAPEGLALNTKITNPKANTDQPFIFFSILFWTMNYCAAQNELFGAIFSYRDVPTMPLCPSLKSS
jgi:hypothetical protein